MPRLKTKNQPVVVAGSGTANTSWGRFAEAAGRGSNRKNELHRLQQATLRLAELLIDAAPLIELLDSSETPHNYRAALTELVGMRRYLAAMSSLQHMSSRAAWDKAHPRHQPGSSPPDPLAKLGVGRAVPVPYRRSSS